MNLRTIVIVLAIMLMAVGLWCAGPRDGFTEFKRVSSPDGTWTVRFTTRWHASYCEAWASAYDKNGKCFGKALIGKYEDCGEADLNFKDARCDNSHVWGNRCDYFHIIGCQEWGFDMKKSDFTLNSDDISSPDLGTIRLKE